MSRRNNTETPRKLRCAIYTRKSTEEGLDLEFNSLDAQREAGEAYIASQKAEGWVCLPTRYDDGGFSGGSMERPALEHLLRDVDGRPITAPNSSGGSTQPSQASIRRPLASSAPAAARSARAT